MTLRPSDRRALAWLAVSLLLGLVIRFWPNSEGSAAVVVPAGDPVTLAETRLARLREAAATVPAKENIFKKVSADLAVREKGIITADTAAQAQALVIQIIRRLGAAETPPIDIRSTELNPLRPFGDAYGEASVAVQIECRIDQLVNLLAALESQPELVATSDLRVLSANAKEKTVAVRLTVSGVVPRRLVSEKSIAGKKKTGGSPF
jgi:Type II secretion system (T2SS), protein M subtype b